MKSSTQVLAPSHVSTTIDMSDAHFGRDYAILGGSLLVFILFGLALWKRYRG